jgi:hypothetical protein
MFLKFSVGSLKSEMKNVIPEPITDLLILFATNLFKIDLENI